MNNVIRQTESFGSDSRAVRRFEWRGETIRYVSEGTGPAVVLLHGFSGSAENWLLQRRRLAQTHRVLTPDLPGHGRSTGRAIDFADYWRVIEAMLDNAGEMSATMCGLAAGARVGAALAAQRPERVRAVIIVNSFFRLNAKDRAQREELYELLLEEGGVTLWADRLLALMDVSDHPVIARGFHRSLAQIDPHHIRRVFLEQLAQDQRPELEQLGCPVLVIRGARDALISDYVIEETIERLERAEMVVLETGHLPYLEAPADFDRTVLDFLERNHI
ncbi:alpha/beta hydrolase [Rhizobium sp. 18065]|uniref:alpha/beta fold hydrolase n=1 Tax=Rhizobium sp. 18065 TaxID=2681411 RepID=UPI001359D8E6|nr:alpha/beta hydrolase [Rhizobium sp. 18065]